MRDLQWVDSVIKIILAISALLVIARIFTLAHFVIKFW